MKKRASFEIFVRHIRTTVRKWELWEFLQHTGSSLQNRRNFLFRFQASGGKRESCGFFFFRVVIPSLVTLQNTNITPVQQAKQGAMLDQC